MDGQAVFRYGGRWGSVVRSEGDKDGGRNILIDGKMISPRKLFKEFLGPKIEFSDSKDLVILIIEAENQKGERYRMSLFDQGDEAGNFSAMERTTAFPTGAIAYLQASGQIPPGATPIEKSVPLKLYLAELEKRDLTFQEERN